MNKRLFRISKIFCTLWKKQRPRGLTLRVLTTCRSCPTHDCTTLLCCLYCTRTTDSSKRSNKLHSYFVFISFPLKQIKQCNYLPNIQQTANMFLYELIALLMLYVCTKLNHCHIDIYYFTRFYFRLVLIYYLNANLSWNLQCGRLK